MKRFSAYLALALAASTAPGWASGTHAGGHDDLAVGKPAGDTKPKRTITIVMSEKPDGRMVFEPGTIQVRKGETVRLRFTNRGASDHEFVMDDEKNIQEHKVLMAKFPEMEHEDPNAIRLSPGKAGDIVWTFSNSGDFSFACLIPGHYEAGMKGTLKVLAQ